MWRIFYKVQIVWYVCVLMLCFSSLFTEIWAENVAIEICISSSNFWFLGLGIIIFEKGHIRDFWAGSSCDDYLDRGGASRSPLLEGSIFIITIIAIITIITIIIITIIIIIILGKVFISAVLIIKMSETWTGAGARCLEEELLVCLETAFCAGAAVVCQDGKGIYI